MDSNNSSLGLLKFFNIDQWLIQSDVMNRKTCINISPEKSKFYQTKNVCTHILASSNTQKSWILNETKLNWLARNYFFIWSTRLFFWISAIKGGKSTLYEWFCFLVNFPTLWKNYYFFIVFMCRYFFLLWHLIWLRSIL